MKNIILFFLLVSITCSASAQIQRKVDEFNGDITLRTPLHESIFITKYITKKDSSFYLSLRTCSGTLSTNHRGVYVLFTDSTKLTIDEEIEVEASSDRYCDFEYSAFCDLKPEQLMLFRTKTVKAFRLFIFDSHLDAKESFTLQINANLLAAAR